MKRSHSLFTLVALSFALSGSACAQPAPQDKAPENTYHEFTGIVTAIDAAALTISVKKGTQEQTFAVDGNTTIKLKREYKLARIPAGSKVFVRYKDFDGKMLAVRVQIIRLSRAIKGSR
jgi:hypothetical protein